MNAAIATITEAVRRNYPSPCCGALSKARRFFSGRCTMECTQCETMWHHKLGAPTGISDSGWRERHRVIERDTSASARDWQLFLKDVLAEKPEHETWTLVIANRRIDLTR